MSGKLNYSKAIEPCSPGAGRTLFDGPGQHVEVDDIRNIRLLSDRVLIRDIPQADEQRGSIVIPEVAQRDGVGKGGLLRIGVVVVVGPGDRFLEHGLDGQGGVRRTEITEECGLCDGTGSYRRLPNPEREMCRLCRGTGRIPVTIPTQCQVGDKVLYDRFRTEEMVINGERFQLSHAEQTVFAVLED